MLTKCLQIRMEELADDVTSWFLHNIQKIPQIVGDKVTGAHIAWEESLGFMLYLGRYLYLIVIRCTTELIHVDLLVEARSGCTYFRLSQTFRLSTYGESISWDHDSIV